MTFILLPGGSCIPKILKNSHYEGIVGVACGEEMKIMGPLLSGMNVTGQGIPLIKEWVCKHRFQHGNTQKSPLTAIQT